ncbi:MULTISPECIES: DUF2383 domain-containing protein [Aequorivita]|jgi:uncharacterized protein (TIGR02284 family)|uniref:DUF2383 domain-containing protein n=2 Tax=Aequorivita TaxID=153265 RepID=A0AB35YWQ3_9FLAO|nr:DUF2383 domain-containing protein [Aequorivita sp. Ant34-E75]WGF91241.1 DUF2383 domain-containing protein [Aequorivita sp. Ant34-E75]
MKKNYADFNKLNRLLVACFEAEKLYYNAAQDVQTTDLKRFLNYMAVERNRMSHDISNELHSRDIEPLKQDSEKGNIDRTWQEIKEALEHINPEAILNSCISRDKNNLKRYDELLERKELPEIILELLEKQKYQLEWYIKQAAQQLKNSPFIEPKSQEKKKEEPPKVNEGGKVINLKAM